MLYDYFTKSASPLATLATVSGLGGAGVGALGSELSGGDWKDNLINAAGAGVGTVAGGLGGGYGAVRFMSSEPIGTDLDRSFAAELLRDTRAKLKSPDATPLQKRILAESINNIKNSAPAKILPGNSKVLKLGRFLFKHPFLSLGTFAGLGGGLGYATTNAFTGKKEKTAQDIIKDILGKA